MMREVRTRFGRNHAGYLWVLAEPVFWIATFAGIRYAMGAKPPSGMDMISFLVTGITVFILFRSTLTHSMASIVGNRPLLYYPQVRPLDIALARSLLEAAALVIVFVVLLVVNGLYRGELRVDNILQVSSGLLLAWLLGSGLGLFFMGLNVYSPAVERIVPIVMRPMLFLSGVFFTVGELPQELARILLFNPVLHVVELVRDGWFREFHSDYVNLGYVLAWIFVFGYLGLLFERYSRRRAEFT